MKTTVKIGDKIQCYIDYANEIFDGVVIGIGTHKGRKIYDLDNSRFVYESQILGIWE